jgi:hypothetical protein
VLFKATPAFCIKIMGLSNFRWNHFMVTAILFAANSAKAVVMLTLNGSTYLCDINIEGNTIYIENCTGIIGEVEVTGDGNSSGGGGSHTEGLTGIPASISSPTGGGGGSSSPNSTNNNNNQKDELSYSKFGPDKIDIHSMNDQEVLKKLIEWYKWICQNKEFVTPSVEMMVETKHLSTSGPIGIYENGSGLINGVRVIWQIQAVSGGFAKKGLNSNLDFFTSDEPPYYRAQLNYYGQHREPRITLLFKSASDRRKVLGGIPCVW